MKNFHFSIMLIAGFVFTAQSFFAMERGPETLSLLDRFEIERRDTHNEIALYQAMLNAKVSKDKHIVRILEIKHNTLSLIDRSVERLLDGNDLPSPVIMAELVKDAKGLIKLQKKLTSQ